MAISFCFAVRAKNYNTGFEQANKASHKEDEDLEDANWVGIEGVSKMRNNLTTQSEPSNCSAKVTPQELSI